MTSRAQLPLTWRFALVPAVVVALLTAVMLALAQWLLVGELSRSTELRLERRAALLALQLDAALQASVGEVRLLARSPRLLPDAPAAPLAEELENLRRQSPHFVWLGLVGLDGRVIAGTRQWLQGESIAQRPVFLQGLQGSFVGDAHPAVALAPLMTRPGQVPQELIDISEPVRDAQGRVVAVLAAHLGTAWIDRLRAAAIGEHAGAREPAFSVHVLSGPSGRNLLPQAAPPPGLPPRIDRAGTVQSADGRAFFGATAELAQAGAAAALPWRVMLLQDRRVALSPAAGVMRSMALLGTLAALILAALGAWAARRLIQPFSPLFDAVMARTGGGTDTRALADGVVAASRALAQAGREPTRPEALLTELARGARELRRVIDHLPLGVAMIDRRFRVEHLNTAYTRLLGWTTEQVRGRIAAEFLFDAVERDEFVRLFAQMGDEPGELTARFEALTPDGRRVAVQWHLVPMLGADGTMEGAIAVVHDIRPERLARARADAMAGRLRALADAAVSDGLATLDGAGRVLEWSHGAERLSGHAASAAVGRPLAELLQPRGDVAAWLLQARRDGRCPVAAEMTLADGRRRWFEGSIYALGLAPGLARFGVILRDLSDAREAHHALQRSEARLRLALDAARMGTWEVDLSGPAPLASWSAGYAAILGLPGEGEAEPVARLHALIHPEDWPAVRAASLRTMRHDEPLATEFRIRKGQAWRWHALYGRAQGAEPAGSAAGERGRVARIVGVGMDITERYEAEHALADSEARLSAVVASASDAIISTDIGGRISLFNPAAERIFGHAAETMIGRPLERLLPAGARPGHSAHLAAFSASGVTRRAMGAGRVAGHHADGRPLDLEASISQAVVRGQMVLTAILRDVTERATQERALETTRGELAQLNRRLLDQEKTTTRRLAQALHDELGQTLTALRLHWEALRDAAPGAALQVAQQRERVDRLVVTANRQIRGVLGELRPPLLDELGLAAALDNELQQQRPVGGRPVLQLLAPPRLQGHRWPADVEYAAFMIGREALVNALHHAHAARITLRLDGDEGQLELSVTDDGTGLPPAARAGRPGHLGLVGMRERALAIGGSLQIQGHLLDGNAAPGTRITLQWTPLDEPDLPGR